MRTGAQRPLFEHLCFCFGHDAVPDLQIPNGRCPSCCGPWGKKADRLQWAQRVSSGFEDQPFSWFILAVSSSNFR
jgi:hypothetical protein